MTKKKASPKKKQSIKSRPKKKCDNKSCENVVQNVQPTPLSFLQRVKQFLFLS